MHKFVSNHSTVKYQEIIYCEKCGVVSWYANDSPIERDRKEKKLSQICQADDTVTTTASPDSETTLEAEKNAPDGDERSSDD